MMATLGPYTDMNTNHNSNQKKERKKNSQLVEYRCLSSIVQPDDDQLMLCTVLETITSEGQRWRGDAEWVRREREREREREMNE
jgi:hypothetical protein